MRPANQNRAAQTTVLFRLRSQFDGERWPDSGGEADPATRGSDTQEEQNLQNRLTKDWDQVLLQSSGRDPQPVGDNWANSSQVNIMSGPSPWGTEGKKNWVTYSTISEANIALPLLLWKEKKNIELLGKCGCLGVNIQVLCRNSNCSNVVVALHRLS